MNKVIVIGTDHINTLGILRNLGENNIYSELIIISNKKSSPISKSKYINSTCILDSENKIAEYLIGKYMNEPEKPIIICSTDGISCELDKNYSRLEKYFNLSNVKHGAEKLDVFMNKYNQYIFAKESGIKVPKTEIINLTRCEKSKINFPIIMKPVLSAYGNKTDITICKLKDEFEKAKIDLLNKGYTEILIQELVKYEFECDIAGYSYDNNVFIPGIIKKIYIWPAKKGSTTFGEVLPIKDYIKDIELIKKMILDIGYEGIFDIDFFIKDDKLIFNEINFRNGALSYAYGSGNICFGWYKCVTNKKYLQQKLIDEAYYFVDDNSHIHNILDHDISIKQYIKDLKKSKIKLSYNSKDKKPWIFLTIAKIKNKILKK